MRIIGRVSSVGHGFDTGRLSPARRGATPATGSPSPDPIASSAASSMARPLRSVQTNSGSSESGPSGPTRVGGRGHAAVLDSSDPNRQIHMQQGDHLKQARHQLGDSSAPRGVNLYESDCVAQRCGVRRHPYVGDRYIPSVKT